MAVERGSFQTKIGVTPVLAVLTSAISTREVGTALFYEELHTAHRKGAWVEMLACMLRDIVSVLSVGAYANLQLFGRPTSKIV